MFIHRTKEISFFLKFELNALSAIERQIQDPVRRSAVASDTQVPGKFDEQKMELANNQQKLRTLPILICYLKRKKTLPR